MSLVETLEASKILRQYTSCFESASRKGKHIEARTYLPNIKAACQALNMSFIQFMGAENERFFISDEPITNRYEPLMNCSETLQKVSSTVGNGSKRICRNCSLSIEGMKSNAIYCSRKCINNSRPKVKT